MRAVYRTELFARSYAELLPARYEVVLSSLADDTDRAVGEVRCWSDRDHEVIRASSGTAELVEFGSVLHAVQEHVRRAPDAVAVVEADRSVSYGRCGTPHTSCPFSRGMSVSGRATSWRSLSRVGARSPRSSEPG